MSFEIQTQISNIKHVILVSSGKGGVGKSTVAANLAASLCLHGHQVGLLDADIHGPSQLMMWGVHNPPALAVTPDGTTSIPVTTHGIRIMSMASRIKDNQTVKWRGPMLTMALLNMIFHTQWGELDYLVVDMPPGTGDIQISICEKLSHAGVIIVTTPQPVALIDCRKGLQMYVDQKMQVLGVVENMSGHVCGHCGHTDEIFGAHGGSDLAKEYDIPLLAQIPIQTHIRSQADAGTPAVLKDPHSSLAKIYDKIVSHVIEEMS